MNLPDPNSLPEFDILNKGFTVPQLQELPPPISESWLPQTIGCFYLLAILMILVISYLLWRRHHWQRNLWRRQAWAQLQQLEQLQQPEKLISLIQRVALLLYPREQVAQLVTSTEYKLTHNEHITHSEHTCSEPFNLTQLPLTLDQIQWLLSCYHQQFQQKTVRTPTITPQLQQKTFTALHLWIKGITNVY